MLQLLKENWEMLGIKLKLDNNIIRLMKNVKAKFDKARANTRMTEAKKCEVVKELKDSTMNIRDSALLTMLTIFLLSGGTF